MEWRRGLEGALVEIAVHNRHLKRSAWLPKCSITAYWSGVSERIALRLEFVWTNAETIGRFDLTHSRLVTQSATPDITSATSGMPVRTNSNNTLAGSLFIAHILANEIEAGIDRN